MLRRSRVTLTGILAISLAACSAQSAAPGPTASPPPAVQPTAISSAPPTLAAASTIPLAATWEPGATARPDAIRVQLGTCCDLLFVPAELTVPAGTLSLYLVNFRNPEFPFDHDIHIGTEIGQAFASSPVVRHGKIGILTIEDIPPGNYVYWCEVNNHEENGMVGKLTVTD